MPKFCEYRNCQNLGVSWLSGYCNQSHYDRGMELELKEALEKIQKKPTEKELEKATKQTTSSADAGQGNHTSCGGASQSVE